VPNCLLVAPVSLMDALAEVRTEETCLRDAGVLQSSTVLVVRSLASRSSTVLAARSLASHSSSARPAAPVPLASPPVVLSAAHGESVGLHCDHCGRDGHVEAFCYRKKKAQKAQTRCSSHDTSGTGYGGSERSYARSET
jgi:hypothetical protein